MANAGGEVEFFTDIPTYGLVLWVVLIGITAVSLIIQALTLSKLNHAAIYLGCSFCFFGVGILIAIHEVSRAVRAASEVGDLVKRHIILADGAALALTVVALFAITAVVAGVLGALMAYVREWIYREELS